MSDTLTPVAIEAKLRQLVNDLARAQAALRRLPGAWDHRPGFSVTSVGPPVASVLFRGRTRARTLGVSQAMR